MTGQLSLSNRPRRLKDNRILCYDCKLKGLLREESLFAPKDFRAHVLQAHGEEIRYEVIATIKTMEPRIQYILTHDKNAQSDPARVIELYGRLAPFMGKYQIVYDGKGLELPRFDHYHDFSRWRRHITSIDRIERGVRRRLGIEGTPRAELKRELHEQVSRERWAGENA